MFAAGAGLRAGRILSLSAILWSAAHAAALAETRYAFLVGVHSYDVKELRPLEYSLNDVTDFQKLLQASGFEARNVVVLHAKQPARYLPERMKILAELDLLTAAAQPGDTLIIALSGHGVQFQDDPQAYFCPLDANLQDKTSLISLSEICTRLDRCPATRKLLLVDACRDDPLSKVSRAADDKSVTLPQIPDTPQSIVSMFSCAGGQRSFEHPALQHGVFFHYVLKGWDGEADLDGNGALTLDELAAYVRRETTTFARLKLGAVQTPHVRADVNEEWVLRKLTGRSQGIRENAADLPVLITGQSEAGREVVRAVVKLLEDNNYRGRRVDDDRAARWIEQMLQTLDGSRVYFQQSDVKRFRSMARTVDDAARNGDIAFAYDMFQVLIQRQNEAWSYVHRWLEETHDFSVEEFLDNDRSRAEFFATAAEQEDYWRKRCKHEFLRRKIVQEVPPAEIRDLVARHFRLLFQYTRQVNDDQLQEWALSSLALAFDPHSAFIGPRALVDFNIGLRLNLVGIGAQLQSIDGYVEVTRIIDGGPAAIDGRLRKGDRIVAVGQGVEGPWDDVVEVRLSDAVDKIRGASGSIVRLRVQRPGAKRPEEIRLTRGPVELTGLKSTVLRERRDGVERKVGYIDFDQFYTRQLQGGGGVRTSVTDMAEVLDGFRRDGVSVVVLDARSNSGGRLQEAIDLPAVFLGPFKSIRPKDATGTIGEYSPVSTELHWDGPLLVVLDRISAGGTEIAAGSLQEYRRAVIVGGRTSNGYGTIATLLDVAAAVGGGRKADSLGALRVTNTMNFFSSGEGLQLKGIRSDLWLPALTDSMNLGEATLDNVIEPETIAATGIRKAPHVNDDVVAELTRLSNERRENSPEFRQYLDDLRRGESRLRDALVLLQEQAFAERMLDGKPAEDDPHVVFQRNPYNNEVLGIALDYAAYWDRHKDFFEGSVLLRNGKHREALAALSRAAAQAPNDSRVRLQLSRAHAFLGDWTKALDEAKRAGYSALDAYAGQEAKLEAKGQDGASLAAGTRVQITHVNKEWIWAADVAKPDVKGWVKPVAILPLLDGE